MEKAGETQNSIPEDVILHPEARKFLKGRALNALMKTSLTKEQRKIMELCVAEAEYHEALAEGKLYNKDKFIEKISEAYSWRESKKTARGRPRKGPSKAK